MKLFIEHGPDLQTFLRRSYDVLVKKLRLGSSQEKVRKSANLRKRVSWKTLSSIRALRCNDLLITLYFLPKTASLFTFTQ